MTFTSILEAFHIMVTGQRQVHNTSKSYWLIKFYKNQSFVWLRITKSLARFTQSLTQIQQSQFLLGFSICIFLVEMYLWHSFASFLFRNTLNFSHLAWCDLMHFRGTGEFIVLFWGITDGFIDSTFFCSLKNFT